MENSQFLDTGPSNPLLSIDSAKHALNVEDPGGVNAPIADGTPGRPAVPPEFVRSEIRLHALFFLMAAIILLMSILMRTDGDEAVFLPGFSSPLPDTCSSRRMLGN